MLQEVRTREEEKSARRRTSKDESDGSEVYLGFCDLHLFQKKYFLVDHFCLNVIFLLGNFQKLGS